MIRMEFYVPDTNGLGEEAIALWRPDIKRWVEENSKLLSEQIQKRLSRRGGGRPSAPGQAPALQTGQYAGSWRHEVKELKRSTHGRIGSGLWARFGAALELGTETVRPRPIVGATIARWMRYVKQQIEATHG